MFHRGGEVIHPLSHVSDVGYCNDCDRYVGLNGEVGSAVNLGLMKQDDVKFVKVALEKGNKYQISQGGSVQSSDYQNTMFILESDGGVYAITRSTLLTEAFDKDDAYLIIKVVAGADFGSAGSLTVSVYNP